VLLSDVDGEVIKPFIALYDWAGSDQLLGKQCKKYYQKENEQAYYGNFGGFMDAVGVVAGVPL
jgi:hypothetical protein